MHGVLGLLWRARHLAAAAAVARSSVVAMHLLPRAQFAPLATSSTLSYKPRSQIAVLASAAGRKQNLLLPTPRPLLPAEDAFYAASASSFEELGIVAALADSLRAAGFVKPSRVQVSYLLTTAVSRSCVLPWLTADMCAYMLTDMPSTSYVGSGGTDHRS